MATRYQSRHFRQFASLIYDLRSTALDTGDMYALETVDVFKDRLSTLFTRDNPRFSRVRFLAACEHGITHGRKG